ncbi:MAG: glucose 1-dehydrogenase [Chloroflexi bacterium]|nr:glucose 1-dehydrogenase [Chloroflexota bacterium]
MRVRITEYLDIDLAERRWRCNRCAEDLGPAERSYKEGCFIAQRDPREVHPGHRPRPAPHQRRSALQNSPRQRSKTVRDRLTRPDLAEGGTAMQDLDNKVIVVTGAGQGIGRAYAHRLGQAGAQVVIAEVNADKGRAVADEVERAGGRAVFIETDVSSAESCARMVAQTTREFGRLDGLINNAALFSTVKMKPFWEIEPDEWDRMMAINVRGVWLAARAAVPTMQAQRWGRIVNISSAVIWMGRQNYLHYVASKGAVFAMTRAMARELGDWNITVNAITPGATYTEIERATVSEQQKHAIIQQQSIKRPETPADLAGVVAFLCSEEAGFITGQTVNVDGGLMMH